MFDLHTMGTTFLLPLLVGLAALSQQASSNSEGTGAACADATATLCTLDCPDVDQARNGWTTTTNGVQSPCCPPGMDLVHPPSRNTDYTITLKGAGSPSNLAYRPCELLSLAIEVVGKDKKYLGLLLYFENAAQEQVGEWIVPSQTPTQGDYSSPKFHTCGGTNTALMHANANTKHYHHTFRWQAPPAGSGPLTLRALLKHGQTNGGAFYWPGKLSTDGAAAISITQDVVVAEAPTTVKTSRWLLADTEETCDVACADKGGSCDAEEMIKYAQKNTVEEQYEQASALFACRLPPMKIDDGTCKRTTFTVDTNDGSCFYQASDGTCANAVALCSTASQSQGKICACKNVQNVEAANTCPSAKISAGRVGAEGENGDETDNAVVDKNPDNDDWSKYQGSWDSVIAKTLVADLNVEIEIILRGKEAWIRMIGPKDKWFGISFGTKTMSQSYAIIFQESKPHERQLDAHSAGVPLPTSLLYVDNYHIENGQRSQTVMRPINHKTGSTEYYSFAACVNDGCHLPFIVAVGQDQSLGYHSPTSRAAGVLEFLKGGPETNDDQVSTSTGNKREPPRLWWLTAVVVVWHLMVFLPVTTGHNWIANPTSRIQGLGRTAPCPPRPGKALHIAVRQSETFPVEWSDGHPGTFMYFTLVPQQFEHKLRELTTAMKEQYIKDAPVERTSNDKANGFLSDSFFDRIATRFTTPNDQATPGMGNGNGGSHYTKILTPADKQYYTRPDSWRCSRHSGGKTCAALESTTNEVLRQYQYVPADLSQDIRVAYENPVYPWITAMYKVKITYKRPKDHSMGRFAFPEFAVPGAFVLQYAWRGYYDCFDVLLLPGPSAKAVPVDPVAPPELQYEDVWIKEDHTRFETFTRPSNWCHVVPPNGDLSQCVTSCDATKKNRCTGINIVPLINPPMARFGNDVVTPFNNKKCNQANLLAIVEASVRTKEEALICFGLQQPAVPEVGTPWTESDDPRDVTFYSTVLRKATITKVKGVADDTDDEQEDGVAWRFGDQCLSCAGAKKVVGDRNARWWEIAEECTPC